MFRNYINNTNNGENETENWSYPAGFERFNSANIPRSRLGKRRTINPSAEVKRSILNAVSSDNRGDNKNEFKNFASKTSSLTHPVNSFLTPSFKKVDNCLERNQEGNAENRICDTNAGHSTPRKIVGSYPLQEVNNFLNDHCKILSTEKPKKITCPLQYEEHDQQNPDVKKILNKSFEAEKTTSSAGECTQLYSFSSNNNGATQSDSSHSELYNNSSFMTAHDVYNFDKNRSYRDFFKTPVKGYGLFDMVASPLDSLSTHTDDENDSLREFIVNTPALSRYDPLHSPYKSQMRHDIYTPLKSKILTPRNGKHLGDLPEQTMEIERSENNSQDCVSRLEDGLRTECNIGSASKLSSESNNSKKLIDLSLGVGINSAPLETIDSYKNGAVDEFKIKNPPPSVEKLMQRQKILEGLGWTIPHATFNIHSPIKETPSTMDKGNSEIESNLVQPIVHKIESEIRPDIHESVFQKKSNLECITLSNSSECVTGNDTEGSGSIFINSKKSSNGGSDEIMHFKMDESTMKSLNISKEPKKHDIPVQDEITDINNFSNFSTYPSKTDKNVLDETNISAPNLKHAFALEESKNGSQNKKENTVVMCPIALPNKETSEKLECYETVIMQSGPTKLTEDKPVVERQIEKKERNSAEECYVNETPLFGYQRQIMRPLQANIIYVNKKPYTVLSMLGRGGSSEVYQVLETNSSKLMALKCVNLSSVEDAVAKGYLNEIEVLSKLQGCPSVIKMFDNEYILSSKILYVLMEKGDTDFSRLMKDITKTKKISMAMIIYYWTEILNAVKDIHDKGIIHSDLKPANFLLVSGRLKLIDFGIASSLQGDMTSVLKDVTTGTFNYMSPEAIRNSGETRGYKINYKSDIWSLGCILYNLLYGRTPFSHLTHTWSKLQAIADPETAVTFPTCSTAPPHLLLSVRWALTKDPKERPTAEELLKLAELTPGLDTQLGRQISSLFGEYIYQMFPNCRIKLEIENSKDKKQANHILH